TFWHSSLELFNLFCQKLGKQVKKVLLETGDPNYNKFRNNDIQSDYVNAYFDEVHFLSFPQNLKKNYSTFLNIVRYQKQFKKIFDKYNPDLIITTGDRNHFYPFLQNCKRSNVQILMFQESLLSVRYYLGQKKKENIKQRINEQWSILSAVIFKIFNSRFNVFGLRPLILIDHTKGWGLNDIKNQLFLWGPLTEKLFIEHRCNINSLGNPLIDNLYNKEGVKNKKNENLSAGIGCDPSKNTILISAPCLADVKNTSELFFWYKSIVDAFSELNIVIKIHPRDDINNFKMLADYQNICIVKEKYSFKELLQISDLSLSHYSATTIDAVAFGLPVILLPMTAVGGDDREHWFSSPIFLKPKSIDSCIHLINEVLKESYKNEYNSERDSFMFDMFSENVGHSTDIIIKEINKILKSN
ncbi:MAG: CDP-glycerol glycerophosphotransferase family protein, partial [Proteobacteria bacterium]|nr:CDP-glycerol glycerophosphotransferase family protein [Pseudomonadota bacterium]